MHRSRAAGSCRTPIYRKGKPIFNGPELKTSLLSLPYGRQNRPERKEVIILPANCTKSRKELFCCWYAALGCAEEAALRAGFPRETALAKGLSLLSESECRRRISDYRKALSEGGSVMSGLRRLAFGSCADAVSLVFADELPSPGAVKGLDLFCVSEIKRDKNGGVEIKLFDRLKALEKLYELERMDSEGDTARSLIEALAAPAKEDGNEDQ